MEVDERYMQRAIRLARLGEYDASPNPMVGAVIVGPDGLIIGEGHHRRCGEGHAEVNAVASVGDRSLLSDATIYVTLEPCSHYGKTPPCAKLIIDSGIKRCVVGSVDPFAKVSGRGIAMLREAGVEVVTGVLDRECRAINPHFFKAHTERRPYITLKWAESADGYLDRERRKGEEAARFSTALTSLAVHKLRATHDAILTGSGTVAADDPRLTIRGLSGRQPLRVIVDRRGEISADSRVVSNGPTLVLSGIARPDIEAQGAAVEVVGSDITAAEIMKRLYERNITSVLTECGPRLLQSLIDEGLWDSARIERSSIVLGGEGRGRVELRGGTLTGVESIDGRTISSYERR